MESDAQQRRIEALERKLQEMEDRVVPRGVCQTCQWFTFNPPDKTIDGHPVPRNRYCQYQGNIRLEKGRCAMWKKAEDLWQRVPRNITV